MATIKDVARRAQVSTATVSYVLNGTGVVSDATRERVLAAVAELGYQPNYSARALRTRSHTLGVVAPGIASRLADPATAEILAGLSEAATVAGYCLLIAAPTDSEAEGELDLALPAAAESMVSYSLICGWLMSARRYWPRRVFQRSPSARQRPA